MQNYSLQICMKNLLHKTVRWNVLIFPKEYVVTWCGTSFAVRYPVLFTQTDLFYIYALYFYELCFRGVFNGTKHNGVAQELGLLYPANVRPFESDCELLLGVLLD